MTGESLPDSDSHKNLSFSADHRFTHKPPSLSQDHGASSSSWQSLWAGCLYEMYVAVLGVVSLPVRSSKGEGQAHRGSEGRQGIMTGEEREIGYCLMGIEFQFCKMEKVLEICFMKV